VCHSSPINPDVVFITELEDFFSVNCVPLSVMMEFSSPNRWMILMKKSTTCSGSNFGERLCLNPLRKLVDGDKQVGVAPACFLEGSNQVESPER
jgi:hypothetical protein